MGLGGVGVMKAGTLGVYIVLGYQSRHISCFIYLVFNLKWLF